MADQLGDKKLREVKAADVLPLLSIVDAPPWTTENEYIVTGYRPPMSFASALASTAYFHNETGNIISHLAMAIIFVVLRFVANSPNVTIYCNGAVVCFFLSAMFHAVICVSENIYVVFSKLDYVGIATIVASSAVSITRIIYGEVPASGPMEKIAWLVYVLMVVFILAHPDFHKPSFRGHRALSFVLFAGLVHLPFLFAFRVAPPSVSILSWMPVIAVVLMAVGLLLYVSRWPECAYPSDWFDYFPSHVYFHILVGVGAVFNYWYFVELDRRFKQ